MTYQIAEMKDGYLNTRIFSGQAEATTEARQINRKLAWPQYARATKFGAVWNVAIYENATKDAFIIGYVG